MDLKELGDRNRKSRVDTAAELHATITAADESNTAMGFRSESEVMTAMLNTKASETMNP